MTAPLPCHLLVGLPGSGKSTFAEEWVKRDRRYTVVSTDAIRDRLYGDEAIEGHWPDIEAEVMRQIQEALDGGSSVIYDATNARRSHRLAFLERVRELFGDRSPDWIAWYLEVPLVTCKQRNHQRRRTIPTHVIDDMAEHLHPFEPIVAEGFLDVRKVPLDSEGWFDFSQVFRTLDRTSSRVGRRRNRNSKVEWHPYAKLIDFERLMYLLAYLLHDTSQRLDIGISPEEIATAITEKYGWVYGNVEAIAADLHWLQNNDFFEVQSDRNIELEAIDRPTGVEGHRYSDRRVFLRLLETIRSIVQTPFEKSPGQSVAKSLAELVNSRSYLTGESTLRKDLEQGLYPYKILDRSRHYRQGYYLGSSIFSLKNLAWLHEHLQQQEDLMSHPSDGETYHQILTRIEQLNLTETNQHSPTFRLGNTSIIEVEGLSNISLARRRDRIERAIRDRELLSLKRLIGGGQFPGDAIEMRAYPLQLVFHNTAWYLGFEAEAEGLLGFERLDRWSLKDPTTGIYRDKKKHKTSLKRLEKLYEASAGLFLGRSATAQRHYLSRDRTKKEAVTVTVELWCNDRSFDFISEGTQRFPLQQMKMSPRPHSRDSPSAKLRKLFSAKPTGDKQFPHRYQVRLPIWSLQDILLQRWILGFGGQVKVIEPPELRDRILSVGRSIVQAYQGEASSENPS
ncbi:AAA family ATPase [Baaleninema sp.]|uniref:AAA family ATPase n=1 Tax=Baaleninema sp. TaxID=3101197 RepID=UPI003D01023F